MADESWAHAFSYVVTNEGGFSNNPLDTGGPTNRGITLTTLSSWRGTACTAADVQALSLSETQQIYRARYWTPLRCGELTSEAVATAVFDAAVNCGLAQAAKALQATVGATVDGQLGPQTLGLANQTSAVDVVTGFSYRQQRFYLELARANASKKVFLPTWVRRAALYQVLVS